MSTFEHLLSTKLSVTKEIETDDDGYQRYVISIRGERFESTCIPDDDDYAIADAVRRCIETAITDEVVAKPFSWPHDNQ